MFDDEKIKLIEAVPEADMILVIWIKLLTLAGKKNINGYIFLTENIPYTDEMLATLFSRPLNTIRLALETFKNFGMINYDGDGKIKISNWEKHQNIEGMERVRELGRKRQAKYAEREKQKLLETTDVSKRQNDGTRLDKIREDKKEDIDIKESKAPSIKKEKDPLEFSFTDKCWYGLDDWRIKMFQGKYPNLVINFLLEDVYKTKFLGDPLRYQKEIAIAGGIEKLVWMWLGQDEKYRKRKDVSHSLDR